MLSLFSFILKVAVLTVIALYFALNPGSLHIVWQGYTIDTTVAMAALTVGVLLLIWTVFYRLWRLLVDAPKAYQRYKASKKHEQGYRHVTQGLVAVAAGDAEAAERFSLLASKTLPATPLTKLLSAQAALMNGNAPKARREFTDLLEDKDAAFFGVRGLLQESLFDGDKAEALMLVRKAQTLQPKRLWVLRQVFLLEAQNKEYLAALTTLKQAEKLRVFDQKTATDYRQALYTAEADRVFMQGNFKPALALAQKAFNTEGIFIPAVIRIVKCAEQLYKRGHAIKVLQQAWEKSPHPDLASLWMGLYRPEKKLFSRTVADDARYQWAKQLADLNPSHRESALLLGHAALDCALWQVARGHLLQASDFKGLAALERLETNNDTKAREWLERLHEAPPDYKWICDDCGHTSLDWQGLCIGCQGFNTYQWRLPRLETAPNTALKITTTGGFITPPL